MKKDGLGAGPPPDDVPRSASGRVPQWVIDEAQGCAQQAVPWRAYGSPPAEKSRSPVRFLWGTGIVLAVVVLAIVGSGSWIKTTGTENPGVSNAFTSRPANWPKPGQEESDHPLGVPAPLVAASEAYRFMAHQADGTTPVTYDPCRPIHYVIRQRGEPAGGNQIVTDAVSRVSQATGLRFVYEGATSEAPSGQRPSFQPKKYGDRWAPVLISWVTPNENPDFAADVTGQGGSTSMSLAGRSSAYVTGAVELDAGQIASILQRPNGSRVVRAIVLHELGHLVGLGHVTVASQLMYPQSQPGVNDFGAGDLTGLAALGSGTCQPDL